MLVESKVRVDDTKQTESLFSVSKLLRTIKNGKTCIEIPIIETKTILHMNTFVSHFFFRLVIHQHEIPVEK